MDRGNRQRQITGYLLTACGWLVLLVAAAVMLAPLPDPLFDKPHSTILYDRNGELLSAAIAGDEQWRFPPADSVPEKFAIALKLYEDEYFDFHPGINPVSLWRAWQQNRKAGKIVSGGSTLSMQTARMALGNKPRTYRQKIIEMLTALKMEIRYSKEAILLTYAQNAPYGGNIVGLEAASWRYFGMPPHRLSWAETATLAVLPNQPAAVFPGQRQERLLARRNRLLHKLHARGYLSDSDLSLALSEPLPGNLRPLPNLAYHLLHRSMNEGYRGKRVHTTLDIRIQQKARELVHRHSRQWADNRVYNAAALIVHLPTGRIRAYIGNSRNPGNHGQHVDIVTARRSPGSLLKPILYAAALDEGLASPHQLLPDIPLFYRGFAPQNFDKRYRGAVPAHRALAGSLNVPFVHLLMEYGYEKFHHKLKQLGMASLDQPAAHYGLSLILGGAETTLDELTALYAGLTRAYLAYPHRPYRQGYSAGDYSGNIYLMADTGRAAATLQPDTPLQAASIGFMLRAMQTLNRPAAEAGWQQFAASVPVAWKTGTSYGLRDAWAIGINNEYVVGVWMGNADGEGRAGLTGTEAAAPLLFRLLELVPAPARFDEPYGTATAMCRQSGRRAGPWCHNTYSLLLPDYLLRAPVCTRHRLLHLNAEETHQVNSNCYPVADIKKRPWFVLPPAMAWYYRRYNPGYRQPPPFAPGCRQENEPAFELIYPRQLTRVYIPVEQDGTPGKVVFEAAHQHPGAVLYWHLDDRYLGATQAPHQMALNTTAGEHQLTLVDDHGRMRQQIFRVIDKQE